MCFSNLGPPSLICCWLALLEPECFNILSSHRHRWHLPFIPDDAAKLVTSSGALVLSHFQPSLFHTLKLFPQREVCLWLPTFPSSIFCYSSAYPHSEHLMSLLNEQLPHRPLACQSACIAPQHALVGIFLPAAVLVNDQNSFTNICIRLRCLLF